MTLYFHNQVFVMWKPTVIFWFMALAFLVSRFFGEKTLVQRMMESGLKDSQLPEKTWRLLNSLWVVFFLLLGTVNLFVAYHFSLDTWVNFKLYGISGLLLIFCLIRQ